MPVAQAERAAIPAQLYGFNDPILLEAYPDSPVRKLSAALINGYMHLYHRLETHLDPNLPVEGPVLALTSHFSVLDVPALMAAGPYYPTTSFPIKSDVLKIPLVGPLLRSWRVHPVDRDGRDIAAARAIKELLLDRKQTVVIAAQGTRSRTGRLGPMDSQLVSLTVALADRGVPVVPIVEIGTYEALPPGSKFPLPKKITVVAGGPIDLSPWRGRRLSESDSLEAARHIQLEIARLLPSCQKPTPETPPMWNKKDYVKNALRIY